MLFKGLIAFIYYIIAIFSGGVVFIICLALMGEKQFFLVFFFAGLWLVSMWLLSKIFKIFGF